MTGRGNDIPDHSPRFILRKNDGPFLVQSPSSMSFVLIQGQQYVIPVSNQLVGSFIQASPSVSQTNLFLNQNCSSMESEEKHDAVDDLQELPPALDKVEDEELDENREIPMGFPCEKAFLKEADEFKKSVNDNGVVFHHIQGFAIEESERPLSPVSAHTAKRRDKDLKETSLHKTEESSRKEKKKVEHVSTPTHNALVETVNIKSESSKKEVNSHALVKLKRKSKKCRGNELTQLLNMDFGPKAGERIILDTKRRSLNERHDDENVMKRNFPRRRNFSEDSVSYNSSSKECSESDYPIVRTRGKVIDTEVKKSMEQDVHKKYPLSSPSIGETNHEKSPEQIITAKSDHIGTELHRRSNISKAHYCDNNIRSEYADENVIIPDSDKKKQSENVNHEDVVCTEQVNGNEEISDEENIDSNCAGTSDMEDGFESFENLEDYEQWRVENNENFTNENILKSDLKLKEGFNYRFEIATITDTFTSDDKNITRNESKCLNCLADECSEVYPQYCSIACRQMFIKENGDQYSYADQSTNREYEECYAFPRRTAELTKNVGGLNCDVGCEVRDILESFPCDYIVLNKTIKREDGLTTSETDSNEATQRDDAVIHHSSSQKNLVTYESRSSTVIKEDVDDQGTLESKMEQLIKIHPYNWTVEETCTWILSVTGSRELAETFEKEVIDASVLFSLSSKEMRESPFKLKFGFARKIEVAIEKCCDYWRIPNRLDNQDEALFMKDISSITVDDLYRMVFYRTKDKTLASRIKDEEIDGFILQITSWEELRSTCVTEDLTKLGVKWKVDRVEHLFNSLKNKCVK